MAVEIRCSGCGAKGPPDTELECSCPRDNGVWDVVGILMIYAIGIGIITAIYFIGGVLF